MQLPDDSIDVAIDKSTLDTMIHGSLWEPPDDVRENVGKYVEEVQPYVPLYDARMLNATGCAGAEARGHMASHRISTATFHEAVT